VKGEEKTGGNEREDMEFDPSSLQYKSRDQGEWERGGYETSDNGSQG